MKIPTEFDIKTREIVLPSGKRIDQFTFDRFPALPYETTRDKYMRMVAEDYRISLLTQTPKSITRIKI